MGLESLLEQTETDGPRRGFKSYLHKIYGGIRHFYTTNLSVKFKLLYETAAMFSDRVLTFFGIKYQGGEEANPISSYLFKYFGIVPAEIGSYLIANVMLYLFSNKIHKKAGMSERELLGSAYLGIGGAESLVSLHNYLSLNNYGDFISNMTYTQALLPLSAIVAAPFLYNFIKNHYRKAGKERKDAG